MIPAPQSPTHSLRRNSVTQQLPRETSLDMQADFEIYEPGQGRSSDDERDNLTPAQSRRKAQNRAAYVEPFDPCLFLRVTHLQNPSLVNGLSVSEKSGTSKISRASSTMSPARIVRSWLKLSGYVGRTRNSQPKTKSCKRRPRL